MPRVWLVHVGEAIRRREQLETTESTLKRPLERLSKPLVVTTNTTRSTVGTPEGLHLLHLLHLTTPSLQHLLYNMAFFDDE